MAVKQDPIENGGGGGGGGPKPTPTPVPKDESPPTVLVTSHADGASVLVNKPILVAGTAADPGGSVKEVTVALDGGGPARAVSPDAGWSPWSAEITLASGGQHTLTVKASDLAGNSASASLRLNAQAAREVTIVSPTPGKVTEARAVPVEIDAIEREGTVKEVFFALGSAAYERAVRGDDERWRGTVTLPPRVAKDGTPYEIRARSVSDKATLETKVAITARDQTAPSARIAWPGHGSQIEGTVSGAPVAVAVRVDASDDADAGKVATGVAGVWASINGGSYVPATRSPGDGPNIWVARLTVPAHDEHVIRARCTDVQGFATDADPHTVLVAVPADIPDLGKRTYLSDLLEFALRRLVVRSGGAGVNPAQVSEALGQPFATIAKATDDVAFRPTRALRIAVDALASRLSSRSPAAVARWPLGEGTGATALDATGGRIDGQINKPAWVPGRGRRSALDFDGAATFVQLGVQPRLVLTDAITLAAWIRPAAPASGEGGVILCKEGQYAIGRGPNGAIRWAFANQSPGWQWRTESAATAPDGVWSHVAIAYDGGVVRTYVNGRLTGTFNGTGSIGGPTSGDLRIGDRQDHRDLFKGQIYDVAVFDRPLGEREVRTLVGPPIGRAQWRLDEGAGTVAGDESDGGADGTIVGATWASGRQRGAALLFNGSSSFVKVDDDRPQLVAKVALSISAWIRPTGQGAADIGGTIVSKEGQYIFARYPDGTLRWTIANTTPGWAWQDTSHVVPLNTWTHVALVYDGTKVRTYVDGVLRHTQTGSGQIGMNGTGPSEFRIGSRLRAPTQAFEGQIAEVAVFDRALSETELRALSDRGAGGDSVWLDDALPDGANVPADSEPWDWASADPAPPYSGRLCHRSQVKGGTHQHSFTSEHPYTVDRGDRLFTYVFLDPANPPSQVMLQWSDERGSWEHRAYWGADKIPLGAAGTPSRRPMGPLPATGRWVRLEVPASDVDLAERTVRGLAFTLFDGRASWDWSGKAGWRSSALVGEYVKQAYRALLAELGTSYDELRLMRGTNAADRAALAERLGFGTRPDTLDRLLVPVDEVTEADLQQLFGFPSTYDDPLAPRPARDPVVVGWRTERLRERWRDEDLGSGAGNEPRSPVVDPDVVALGDLADPREGNSAYDLWRERAVWGDGQESRLRTVARAQPTPAKGVAAVIEQVLGALDLQKLDEQRRAGIRIEDALASARLSAAAFDRLLELRTLAAGGPLMDAEWDDLFAILTQVLKLRNAPAWKAAERARDLIVEPRNFRIEDGASFGQVPRWLGSRADREAWRDLVRSREAQLSSVASAMLASVGNAEESALPLLRDAASVPSDAGIDAAEALTRQLQVDVKASPSLVTTRVDQAIEGLAGLLFGARMVRLGTQPGAPPSPTAAWTLDVRPNYQPAQFDAEWDWMQTYLGWRAAISVFLYPENLLLPSLREPADLTQAYRENIQPLAQVNDLSPEGARDAASKYLQKLRERADLPAEVKNAAFSLTEGLSDTQLSELRAFIVARFGTLTRIHDAPSWLRELFLYVPLQLALSLHDSGQHTAALDWFRRLYAYDRPPAQRKIFYGFDLDAAPGTPLNRPVEWLLNDLNPHRIARTRSNTYLAFTVLSLARSLIDFADAEFSRDTPESRPQARALYVSALDVLASPELDGPTSGSTLPANPQRWLLRRHAEVNLEKLRGGLNIAGMQRPPELPATASPALAIASDGRPAPPRPALQPAPYHYSTLIARAQQLVASASQIEAAYLAALEKLDAENYNLLNAGQDLALLQAREQLHDTQIDIAGKEMTLSERQRKRAVDQRDTYERWLSGGPNPFETGMLNNYRDARNWRNGLAGIDALASWGNLGLQVASASGTPWSLAAAAAPALVTGAAILARPAAQAALNNAELQSQVNSFYASYERRRDEWTLQSSLADADRELADQQVSIANARKALAEGEREIAKTQTAHAQAELNFLATKFTSAQLYAWMAKILGEVYGYLLQQATAVAQLAERQLAFERQQPERSFIKLDYWIASNGATGGGADGADGRGLTGSARLLGDITRLDQHAFETNKRKLQLSQSLSLAQLAPMEFQRFRETGELPFATPMELFDRAFPGHYARVIRRVRVSVVGLVPPVTGIRATLANSGISRVVVGDATFSSVIVRREPEQVALTATAGASGVFELDPQSELLLPFEGMGVGDTSWIFRMPRASNPFDYRLLADVVVTFDYTALHSPDHEQQVLQSLPTHTTSDRTYSLRDDFPDLWYGLMNPQQTNVPPPAFAVAEDHFPFALEDLEIHQLTLYAIENGDDSPEIGVARLALRSEGKQAVGTAVKTVDHIVTTRNGSGGNWAPLLGKAPVGEWEIQLATDAATTKAVQDGLLEDLVLCITFRGSFRT